MTSTSSPVGLKAAETVIFVEHARLHHSLAPRDSSPVVSVELEADTSSGDIVCVGTKAIPDLGSRLISSVIVGHNINESPVRLIDELRRRYICASQKAVSTAVLNAFEAYQRYRQVGLLYPSPFGDRRCAAGHAARRRLPNFFCLRSTRI